MKLVSPDAKLQVLKEIEDLLGDRFASKMKKPDEVGLEIHAEGSPEEEAGESPMEEKSEDEGSMEDHASDDDRIHELMTRSGNMMSDEDENPSEDSASPSSDGTDDAALIKQMMLLKKMKG